jgi:hypothetical protein
VILEGKNMARVEQAFFDRTQAMDSDGAYTTASVPYFVFGAETDDEAVAAVYAAAPSEFNSLTLESVGIDERINQDTFKIVVQYKQSSSGGSSNAEEEPEPVYTFDTGGGTQHLTQSIMTVGKYPADAPDYGGAIGYDGEAVAGVDIVQPVSNFAETHYLKDARFTTAYKKSVAQITGTMNNGSFRGYESGEVLFLGASGTKRGDDADSLWEVTYKFAVSFNRKNFKVGDITVAEKYGWDYMWVRYADEIDDSKKTLIKKPAAVYIERVYMIANFGALGIGL